MRVRQRILAEGAGAWWRPLRWKRGQAPALRFACSGASPLFHLRCQKPLAHPRMIWQEACKVAVEAVWRGEVTGKKGQKRGKRGGEGGAGFVLTRGLGSRRPQAPERGRVRFVAASLTPWVARKSGARVRFDEGAGWGRDDPRHPSGKSARTVRREGGPKPMGSPYPYPERGAGFVLSEGVEGLGRLKPMVVLSRRRVRFDRRVEGSSG